MKILRIELFNLNSLAGNHVIDLEHGALAGAGLFAITGSTGAGKSTILDAITLALYGRAARYASTKNPEDMMTRHTGECSAEVTFSVPSGRFRAAWHLSRSRKKPDGKVQPAKRYLYDADGTVMTVKSGDMDREIAHLTGLDAERFLRSVLLAQGDFAQFLKSRPNERAELLESLTGTVIYSELGALAHRESSERQRLLDSKREALGNLELLGDGAREAAEMALREDQEQAGELETALQALRESRRKALELRKALTDSAALDAEAGALAEKRRMAVPDLEKLAAHRSARPFSPALAAADLAERQALVAAERKEKLILAAEAARRAQASGKAEALRLARGWEAGELAARDGFAAEAARQEAAASEAKRLMNSAAADRVLTEILPELFDSLTAVETAERDRKATRAGQLKISQENGVAAERAKASAEFLQAAVKDLGAAQARSGEAARLLKETAGSDGEAGVARKLEHLRERRAGLDRLLQLLSAERKLTEACDQRAKEQEANTRETTEARALADALAAQVRTLRELLDSRERERDAARIVTSLEDHRQALAEGEPCPLCGAMAHPWATGPAGALTENEAETACRKTDTEWRATTAEQSKAAAKTAALQATATELGKSMELLTAERAEAAEAVRSLAENLAVDPPETAQAARDTTEAEGRGMRAVSDQLVSLRTASEAAEKARQNADSQHARLEAEARGAAEAVGVLQKRAEEFALACAESDRACTEAADQANRKLAPFSLTLSGDVLPDRLRVELRARAGRFAGWEKALREATAAGESARGKAREKEVSLTEVRRRIAGWTEAGVVSGAPSASMADGAAEAPWRDPAEAEAALEGLARTAENAAATASESADQAATARTEADGMADALRNTLAGSAFADLAALRAATLEEPAAVVLTNLESALRDEAASLEGRRRAIRETLDALSLAGTAPPEKLPELEQSLADMETAHRTRVGNVATQTAALARDAENRRLHAERAAELTVESDRLAVWRRLCVLIGSADGAKFRTFAQGLTLDALVRRANRHLVRLTDRYILHRGEESRLELIIEDQHQASARRPMESLSGGESFLTSLALALGLSDLAGRNVRIDSLFIDEGFGTLDADTLDAALSALESLRHPDKTIGVISHVGLLKERIGNRIHIEKTRNGHSRIQILTQ